MLFSAPLHFSRPTKDCVCSLVVSSLRLAACGKHLLRLQSLPFASWVLISSLTLEVPHLEQLDLGVPYDIKSAVFLNIVQKGGGSFPCSKILEQILYDFKGILATKIDIKRLSKGRNVSNWGQNVKILGWSCHSFHRFTHYFVKLCRDRRLRAF